MAEPDITSDADWEARYLAYLAVFPKYHPGIPRPPVAFERFRSHFYRAAVILREKVSTDLSRGVCSPEGQYLLEIFREFLGDPQDGVRRRQILRFWLPQPTRLQ